MSGMEDERDRIKEVNLFQTIFGNPINLNDLNHEPFPDIFPRSIYAGTYKSFRTDLFIEHLLSNVNWEYPEYVTVIIREEVEFGLKVYSLEHKRWLA